jgi:hypothetical protein
MNTKLSEAEVGEMMEETTVPIEGDQPTLADLVKDIQVAHKELDDYKRGALTLNQALDERLQQAEQNDEQELIEVLETMKESAFGIYLRIHRGDLELTGGRDGEYKDYFGGE